MPHDANFPGSSEQTHGRVELLNARVSHGDLKRAAYPVMVGHYQGDGIVSAEAVLNQALSYRLSQSHQLGLYPEALNTAEIFLPQNEDPQANCKGAIVIGLGQVGELNSAKLQGAVEHGIISYVHALVERDSNYPADIGTSFLLVGSGPGGMLIEDSITAMLRGVITASQALKICYSNAVQVSFIEFIELYLDRAVHAARVLQQVQENHEFGNNLSINPLIYPVEGGLQRVTYSAYEWLSWWQRMQIIVKDNEALCFTLLVKRARAEDTILHTQRTVIDNLLKHSTISTSSKNGLAETLFELLIPLELKHHVHAQGDVLLLLDPSSAAYPWELLQQKNMLPGSVRSGLIRQLRQSVYRYAPIQADGRDVLVVGDPMLDAEQQTQFPPLQAACDEAVTVNQILEQDDFSVSSLIRETAQPILQALYAKPYRILHLAGHGVYEYAADSTSQPISGMVLSDNIILTPNEINQMQTVPELVFINCCYLGYIEAGDNSQLSNGQQPNLLAANLAQQFIKNGVRCVIAAGWAVDDDAGKHFAEVFYRELVRLHTPFGDAVRKARKSVYLHFKDYNTWGAYQCYGDPYYRLEINIAADRYAAQIPLPQNELRYSSIQELLCDLNNQMVKFPDVIKSIPKQWLNSGELLCALGRAFGQINNHREALNYYQQAYAAKADQIRFETIQHFAELAVEWALINPVENKTLPVERMQVLCSAIRKLESLINISATGSHYALLGKVYRCLALFCSGRARIQAINNMQLSYKKAYEHRSLSHNEPEIEWLSQWMLAALVKSWRNLKNQFDVPAEHIQTGSDRMAAETDNLKSLWVVLDFDLIKYLVMNSDTVSSNRISGQQFINLETYLQVKEMYGVETIRDRLMPTIHFLLEMSQHRRTRSATQAHKSLQILKQTLLEVE